MHWLITFEVLFEFTLVLDIGQVLKSDCACYAAITSLAAFCGRCSQVNIYFKFSYENQSGSLSGRIPIREPFWVEKLENNMTKTWSPEVSIRAKSASGFRNNSFICQTTFTYYYGLHNTKSMFIIKFNLISEVLEFYILKMYVDIFLCN